MDSSGSMAVQLHKGPWFGGAQLPPENMPVVKDKLTLNEKMVQFSKYALKNVFLFL